MSDTEDPTITDDGPKKRKATVHELKSTKPKKVPAIYPGHDDLRDRWIATAPPTVHSRLNFYQYDRDDITGGIWRTVDYGLIESSILQTIERAKIENIKITASLLRSVCKLTEAKLAMHGEQFDSDPNLLVCGNGTLNLLTRKLRPWSEEDFATTRVAYAYDPEAASPAFDRYLIYMVNTLGKDTVDFLQEFIGYSLTTDTSHEIMVWLVGAKGSGKSTFIDAVEAGLSDRRGVFSIKNLNGRFGLIHIPGKTLLTSTENTSARGLADSEGILSTIVSGEDIHIEHKGRDEFTCKPVAKILWAMNEPPTLPKSESGIFRRVNVVNFPPMSKEIEVDPGLKQRIKGEGAGILNWALDGLDRLNARGRFLIPAKVSGATNEYQASCDHIGLFLSERVLVEENARCMRSELYRAFKTWCVDNGIRAMTAPEANKAFQQRFGAPKKISEWFWLGCRLADSLPDPEVSDY